MKSKAQNKDFEAEAAGLAGVSRSTFYQLHNSEHLPRLRKLRRVVVWSRTELIAWFEAGCPTQQRWETIRTGQGGGV